MWIDYVENNIFLNNLYKEVPKLTDVGINEIQLARDGEALKVIFDLPIFPEIIPLKWNGKGYNTLSVELDFWKLSLFSLNYNGLNMKGNIEIIKKGGLIEVEIEGNVKCHFFAEDAFIQKVTPYII